MSLEPRGGEVSSGKNCWSGIRSGVKHEQQDHARQHPNARKRWCGTKSLSLGNMPASSLSKERRRRISSHYRRCRCGNVCTDGEVEGHDKYERCRTSFSKRCLGRCISRLPAITVAGKGVRQVHHPSKGNNVGRYFRGDSTFATPADSERVRRCGAPPVSRAKALHLCCDAPLGDTMMHCCRCGCAPCRS